MKDPYEVLGVSQNATDEEVKKAYREMVRKYHPDNYANNPLADLAQEKMKDINEAYNAITKMRAGGSNSNSYGSYGGNYGSNYGNSSYGGYSQQSSDPEFARARRAINEGRLDEADGILGAMSNRSAEWYFLRGAVAYRKGWADEARQNFRIACQMDPSNMEYRQALARMGNGGFAYRQNQGLSEADLCDCCTTMMCLNCLCGGCR